MKIRCETCKYWGNNLLGEPHNPYCLRSEPKAELAKAGMPWVFTRPDFGCGEYELHVEEETNKPNLTPTWRPISEFKPEMAVDEDGELVDFLVDYKNNMGDPVQAYAWYNFEDMVFQNDYNYKIDTVNHFLIIPKWKHLEGVK